MKKPPFVLFGQTPRPVTAPDPKLHCAYAKLLITLGDASMEEQIEEGGWF